MTQPAAHEVNAVLREYGMACILMVRTASELEWERDGRPIEGS